jgi:hypothetical protein
MTTYIAVDKFTGEPVAYSQRVYRFSEDGVQEDGWFLGANAGEVLVRLDDGGYGQPDWFVPAAWGLETIRVDVTAWDAMHWLAEQDDDQLDAILADIRQFHPDSDEFDSHEDEDRLVAEEYVTEIAQWKVRKEANR